MSLKLDYIGLAGGVDEASGKTLPQKGRLLSSENFEIAFGEPGYRRINGYERFDGRAAPSDAVYWILTFNAGTAAISVGNTVTGPSGSGYVLRVQIDSGAWGANATGSLILTAITGSFSAGQSISVGSPKATATSGFTASSAGDTNYFTDVQLAREYYRGLITKPTGDGPIRGLEIYNGAVYCLRNDVGNLTATLWKSSGSGWSAVRTGMRPNGFLRGTSTSFSGAAGSVVLYGCDGMNRPWEYNAAINDFNYAPAIYGSEGTSASTVTPGTGAKSFVITETARSWVNGDELLIYSPTTAASYMIGTVTSWAAPNLTINATSAAGASQTVWHVCRNDGIDRPLTLAAHKNRLFLAYPKGQLQTSIVGDPFDFTTGAGLFGMSDEIVDLRTLRADTLAVMQKSKISLLYGNDSSDWDMKLHSEASNVRSLSTQEVGGNALFITDAGVMTLAGTQSFGDFDAANMSESAQTSLSSVMADYKCATIVRKSSQYRIYGYNNQVLCLSWRGPTVDPSTVEYMRLKYEHQPVCARSALVGNEEFVVFGTSDGWVMRERKGTTFDGEQIMAFFRSSYWHCGSPHQKKRFRKITLDAESTDQVSILFRQDFDFNGIETNTSQPFTGPLYPVGGLYDVDLWNEFYWDSPEATQLEANVDGVGRYMSILVQHSGDCEPFRIYGIALQYSPIGIPR